MKLRYYQEEAIQSIFKWFADGKESPLAVLATGTGKSLVIADMIRRILEAHPSERIICCIDTKELVLQNYETFLKLMPFAPVGLFSASLNKKQNTQIIFAGIQSIYKHPIKIGKVDLLIADEAHMISDDHDTMWNNFIRILRMINPEMRIVGLTATPYRMSSGLLHTGENAIFKGVCYEYGIKQGIADGFLSEIVPKGMITKLSVDGVGKRGGEYIESQLQKAVNIDEITKEAIKEVIEYGKTRKSWLGFSSGVEHGKAIRDEIRKYGISCEMVDGSTPSAERDEIVKKFKNQEIRCLVNNAVFCKGFDAPNVDMIFCMRPTNSPVFFLQMVGRGFRIAEGKENCLLLDFAQNISRFGTIDTIVFRDKKRKDDEEGVPPMKECPKCSSIVHAGFRECPDCGHKFPEPEREKIDSTANNAPVLSGQDHFEEWEIDDYEISIHKKTGKPDSLKITYQSGILNRVSEFHCFEHGGYATQKARDFWRKNTDINRCSSDMDEDIYKVGTPNTTETAYFLRHCIKIPKAIRVKKEGRYFRIIARSEQEFHEVEEAQSHTNPLELSDSEIPF